MGRSEALIGLRSPVLLKLKRTRIEDVNVAENEKWW
jgi:hypothetical protein